MKAIKNLGSNILKSIKNNIALGFLSIILSVVFWFVVSMTMYQSVPKTISSIPLSIDISETQAAENGLMVIDCDVKSVEVQVLGSRTEVGSLNNENIKAKIDAGSVTAAGTKTLAITITSDSGIEYQVKSVRPSKATVVFDKYDTRPFNVTPRVPNISLAENKTVNTDEITCEPSVINISGPSAQLDQISTCFAVTNKELSISSSYTVPNDGIELYSEDGSVIDTSGLKFDRSNFIINIPVLTQKTVSLGVSFTNVPPSFDTDCLNLKMSADSITIASRSSLSELPESLEIGKIDLRELDLGYSNTFKLSSVLDLGDYLNMSNIESVTVTLDDSALAKKQLIIDQFSVSNPPDKNSSYEVVTKQLTIDVIGPQEVLDELTSSDIIADVNLLNANVNTDTFQYDATVSCPKYDNVWAISKSKVQVKREAASTQPTSSASGN